MAEETIVGRMVTSSGSRITAEKGIARLQVSILYDSVRCFVRVCALAPGTIYVGCVAILSPLLGFTQTTCHISGKHAISAVWTDGW